MEVFIGISIVIILTSGIFLLGYKLKLYPFYSAEEKVFYRAEIQEEIVAISKAYEPSKTVMRNYPIYHPGLKMATMQSSPHTIPEKFIINFHLKNAPYTPSVNNLDLYKILTQPNAKIYYQKGYNKEGVYCQIKLVMVETSKGKFSLNS